MAGEEDKGKNRGRKTTRALKKAVPPGEISLDHFLDDTVQVKQLGVQSEDPSKDSEKKPRKRRAKAELEREWRIKTIEKEHKLDGKSKTINLQRCFLTRLRVSQEVWEEIRARTLESLCKWASEAEERAAKQGRRTIQIQDVI